MEYRDDPENRGVFMNLRTDFAFKRVFGSEAHKQALIRFLNALFRKDGIKVCDVKFLDKEIIPESKGNEPGVKSGKRIIYDVFCISHGTGHHFILEMQQSDNVLFNDRALYYTIRALSMQGTAGWDYNLCPVYSIFILGFSLRGVSRKAINDFRLYETESHELFSDKMRMIFISMPEIPGDWEDCKTEKEQILFIIKNIHTMTKESKPYKSGKFSEIFDASEIGSMVAEDMVLYSQSYSKLRENELSVKFAADQAEARGIAEGQRKERIATARKLHDAGMSSQFIKEITGLDMSTL